MPLFKNPMNHPLKFRFGANEWNVPPGGVCNIPANLVYLIEGRKIPLEKHVGPVDSIVEETIAAPPPAPRFLPGTGVGFDDKPAAGPAATDEPDDEPAEVPAVNEAVERLRSEGALPPAAPEKHGKKGKGR